MPLQFTNIYLFVHTRIGIVTHTHHIHIHPTRPTNFSEKAEFALYLPHSNMQSICHMNLESFDPNGVGIDNGSYFGMPFTPEESRLVLLSVPWDVTVSYGAGTVGGPDAIIGASTQLDLYDPLNPGQWRKGIATLDIDYSIQERSMLLREDARRVITHLESGGNSTDDSIRRKLQRINDASETLAEEIYTESSRWQSMGKVVGLIGGDHSTPLGHIRAVAERHPELGILHIDAHADLRPAYEGFTQSHASIMYNVLNRIPDVTRIVQVGIRDYCDQEATLADTDPRITWFEDARIATGRYTGVTWHSQCEQIVDCLPQQVYVSFDIDGLSPDLCPSTGTPVPGGLSFNEAVYLLDVLTRSGREIVGFDLVEVCPSHQDEWDANVGARILYRLCGMALRSYHE